MNLPVIQTVKVELGDQSHDCEDARSVLSADPSRPRRRGDRIKTGTERMDAVKLPRRKFLHLAASAAALPAVSRIARAQAYPSRPVRIIVGQAAGSGIRHSCSSNWSISIGASWSAIRNREPARRGRKHRHRSGRPFAAGRLYASLGQFSEHHQHNALRTDRISISSATLRRSAKSPASPSSWRLIRRSRPGPFQSSSPSQKPILARSTWHRPVAGLRTTLLASCSK